MLFQQHIERRMIRTTSTTQDHLVGFTFPALHTSLTKALLQPRVQTSIGLSHQSSRSSSPKIQELLSTTIYQTAQGLHSNLPSFTGTARCQLLLTSHGQWIFRGLRLLPKGGTTYAFSLVGWERRSQLCLHRQDTLTLQLRSPTARRNLLTHLPMNVLRI